MVGGLCASSQLLRDSSGYIVMSPPPSVTTLTRHAAYRRDNNNKQHTCAVKIKVKPGQRILVSSVRITETVTSCTNLAVFREGVKKTFMTSCPSSHGDDRFQSVYRSATNELDVVFDAIKLRSRNQTLLLKYEGTVAYVLMITCTRLLFQSQN